MAYPAEFIAFNLNGFGGFGSPQASASSQRASSRDVPLPGSHMLSSVVAQAALNGRMVLSSTRRRVIWHGLSSGWRLA